MTTRCIRAVIAAASLALAAVPAVAAQAANQPNTTGLPLFAHTYMGTQYDAFQNPTDHHWYMSYTAVADGDSLATVEDWYRHQLPHAKETPYVDRGNRGIQLTSGKDKVRIYKAGKNPGAVIMLYKYVRD